MLPSITAEKRTRRVYSGTVKFHKDSDAMQFNDSYCKKDREPSDHSVGYR